MTPPATPQAVYRHKVWVRFCHWVNALCIVVLLFSGAEILAHHPELYWGENGFFGDPYFLSLGSREYEFIGMGTGRSIHFLAAWVLVFNAFAYVLFSLRRHLWRDLLPTATSSRPPTSAARSAIICACATTRQSWRGATT